MNNYKFYKDPDNRWYVDLPSWIDKGGEKADLEMIRNADVFLDILAQGDDTVNVTLSSTQFPDAEYIKLTDLNPEYPDVGAYYELKKYKGQKYNLSMWLCNVTLHVFGCYPGVIYFK